MCILSQDCLSNVKFRLHNIFDYDSHYIRLCDCDSKSCCAVDKKKTCQSTHFYPTLHRLLSLTMCVLSSRKQDCRLTEGTVSINKQWLPNGVLLLWLFCHQKSPKKKENLTVDTYLDCMKRTVWTVNPPTRT